MKKYDLITKFPPGVTRDYITRKFFRVTTPTGEVHIPDSMYTRDRGWNIAACSYAVLCGDELRFVYYTEAQVGRWPFNIRRFGEREEVFARFIQKDGGWEQIKED